MHASMKNKLTGLVTVVAITTSLAACSSNPTQVTACSLPEGPNLERAISAARFDLEDQLLVDQLRPSRSVDMHDRRAVLDRELGAVKNDRHELACVLGTPDALEELVDRAFERHWREGHELRPTESLVQPVIRLVLRRASAVP